MLILTWLSTRQMMANGSNNSSYSIHIDILSTRALSVTKVHVCEWQSDQCCWICIVQYLGLNQCCTFASEICLAELLFVHTDWMSVFLQPDCVMTTLMSHFQLGKCSMHAIWCTNFLNGYEHYYWMSNITFFYLFISFSQGHSVMWLRMQSDHALFDLGMQIFLISLT